MNLPGSPRGAAESVESIIDLLPHVVDFIQGRTGHKVFQSGGKEIVVRCSHSHDRQARRAGRVWPGA